MKQCIECNEHKPLGSFYKHPEMGDGHLGKCKLCTLEYQRERRLTHGEPLRAYDRKRGHLPHRKAANKAWYRRHKNDPAFRAKQQAHNKAWLDKNSIKRAAHIITRNATRTGKITPKKKCEHCGRETKIHGHHEDYTKPFEVTWLCVPCHGLRHREINQLIRDGEDWSEKGF